MISILKKLVGSRNDRLLKQYKKIVSKINGLEPSMQALSDEELKAKTSEFKKRIEEGASLDSLLSEAFAVVREASVRTLGMRHFDVQLIGGIVLHNGKIAEMRTGEGKTLMSTLPVYLNALTGEGVHVVTVNDYLATRDAETNKPLYDFLGMSVGVVVPDQDPKEKYEAYRADITYGTNNEYGFDYLRDNMEYHLSDKRQRKLNYAIVDEVDSILIDEARTPLIISGQAEDNTSLYIQMNEVPPKLTRMLEEPKPQEPEPEGDYWVDEKSQQIYLSEIGHEHAEDVLTQLGILPEGESLYDPRYITLMHHLMAALRAHNLFHKDQHYVVKDGEVVIVDEFTGRFMTGRRWSDGLHQAVEAKEGVEIQNENQTMASITFQNYFRMYSKLAGMTGTADTEAYEFQEIYGLETVIIPTNLPMIRDDQNDQIFLSAQEKYDAIIRDIKDCYERKQPVLVGTTSIESSEYLSSLLQKAGLPHDVLNAKQHAREADIIAEAGKPGKITIATNMAGRGTDIVLGGNIAKKISAIQNNESLSEEQKQAQIEKERDAWKQENEQVKAAGGLRIIGTERHESRRIDNQLRGRAGRQGDKGSSRFYLSLDDNLLRIFAGGRVRNLMERLGTPGEPIEAKMVTRSIESAQRKVEGRNFDIRKHLLEFDNVANDQRRVLYGQRNEVLEEESIRDMVDELRTNALAEFVRIYVPEDSVEEQWDIDSLQASLDSQWGIELDIKSEMEKNDDLDDDDILQLVLDKANQIYEEKIALVGDESWNQFERSIILNRLDTCWREHLAALDHLRQGIHLRGYAQKDPKQEYKREAFQLFKYMLERVRNEVTRILLTVQIQSPEEVDEAEAQQIEAARSQAEHMNYHHADQDEALAEDNAQSEAEKKKKFANVGRNDPCPCGSGKKYKHCHGKLS
ncbi:preprotein translocase subunit SecA [Taylorella asinigenitalis]|uniref:Protein translocase subunit SecA n=1 Tax=Taylorella asinigenitalis (strain MCE3) TaxID=1008459 RepID=G4QC47_TAYAM|nr:preprotein translocase subunit SecA [Taylorella asinigenitalis]AEP37016.1 Protein export cytoplasm protein SecA ATPase RNA helicase [Taylorella asinigenitalis MCE3]